MRLRKPQQKTDQENLIPLINVVFLMLIFFLITGMLKPFSVAGIHLPEMEMNEQLKNRDIKLLISETGQIIVGDQIIAKDDLGSFLSTQKVNGMTAVSFIADRRLSASVFIEIIERAKEAQIDAVHIYAKRQK